LNMPPGTVLCACSGQPAGAAASHVPAAGSWRPLLHLQVRGWAHCQYRLGAAAAACCGINGDVKRRPAAACCRRVVGARSSRLP
jgi:hypothetical protein